MYIRSPRINISWVQYGVQGRLVDNLLWNLKDLLYGEGGLKVGSYLIGEPKGVNVFARGGR